MEPERDWTPKIGERHDWLDKSGNDWYAVDLATSKGGHKVAFLSRAGESEGPNEYYRAIRFPGDKVLPLPYNLGDREIDVYYYGVADKEGPYLRLSDRSGEYLVDLASKTTAWIIREKGATFVGELRPGEDKEGYTITGHRDRIKVLVGAGPDGRVALVAVGQLVKEKGKLVGKLTQGKHY